MPVKSLIVGDDAVTAIRHSDLRNHVIGRILQ
jgi:hypothetical protein